MPIELLPHLFGANRRPTGQRGLYMIFRNSSKPVDVNVARVLLGIAEVSNLQLSGRPLGPTS